MLLSQNSVLTAEVHFSEPPFGGFSYRIPTKIGQVEPGCRVRVPFGKSVRLGFVTKVSTEVERDDLKDIGALIDEEPLLPKDVFALAIWLSDYYLCDFGEALATAFPPGLKSIGKPRFTLSKAGRAEPWIDKEAGTTADLWRALSAGSLSLQQIKNRFGDGQALLEKFRRREWLQVVYGETTELPETVENAYRRTELFLTELNTVTIPANSVKQIRLRELLTGRGELTSAQIRSEIPDAQAALRNFLKRKWLEVFQIDFQRKGIIQEGLAETAKEIPTLSAAQVGIVEEVQKAIREREYKAFLLHGVTGSGKSLIYLEAVSEALKLGKSAILMVPEISLTPQLAGRLRRRFGDQVGILHSGMQNRDRQRIWYKARQGKIRVVVGPRSAVFSPVENLGLIVVDEEHDDSYKQSAPAPRYHGKAAAFFRARNCGATILLGSATPDVVSYHNAKQGRLKLLELRERHEGAPLPDVRIVKWGGYGTGSLFSPQLKDRIIQRLEVGQQIILLLNRRGYATILMCPECGASATCPNCDVSLRYHRVGPKLECHYCDYRQRVIDRCPNCQGTRLRFNGIGTQRVERELELLYPSARIARLDLDTSRTGGGPGETLRGFGAGNFDILLGTQMVAKGHDFPNVTLVGVIGADLELLQSDFRSLERCFRLLVQASGRTGRSKEGGEVIIQCLNPSHPVFEWIRTIDYQALYNTELNARNPHRFPPFGRIVNITLRSETQAIVIKGAEAFHSELLGEVPDVTILGPATPEIERLEGLYRRKILIKLPAHNGTSTVMTKKAIYDVAEKIRSKFGSEKLMVTIDVDPVEG